MARAAAIILKDDCVALIKRQRAGLTYYLFPGGQIEEGETGAGALVREIKEELGLDVEIGQPIAEIEFQHKSQIHYLAYILGGTFGTGLGEEMHGLLDAEYGSYAPVWMSLKELATQDIRPKFVVDLVLRSGEHGWPSQMLTFSED